jgi:hypothetical protein
MRGSSKPESMVDWLRCFSSISDSLWVLRGRAVKLSSSGFISGGRREIFRKVIAKKIDMAREIRCKLPFAIARMKVVSEIVTVISLSLKRVFQWYALEVHSPYDINAVNA